MRMIRINCIYYVSQLEGGEPIGSSSFFFADEYFPQSNVLLIYLRYKDCVHSIKGRKMSEIMSAGEATRFTEIATMIASKVNLTAQQNQGDDKHYFQPLERYLSSTQTNLSEPLPTTGDELQERLNERVENDYGALLKALQGDDSACNIRVTATVIIALEGMKAAIGKGSVTLDGTGNLDSLYNTAVKAADDRISEMTKDYENPVKSMVGLATRPTQVTAPIRIGTINPVPEQNPDLPS
jgi:hypothetical protein